MSKRDVIQSHVEVLMQRFLETDELKVDSDGDIPVSHGSASYYVRVARQPVECPHVEVYAVAVEEIDADPGLYEALNALNRRLSHARVFWSDRKVILAGELIGETMAFGDLACLCCEIGGTAHDEGPRLAATFGGRVAFPDAIDDEENE